MDNPCEEIESLIFQFAKVREWTIVLGAGGAKGSYWIKDGRYRMVSIEPKSYGWLIGISNLLFQDVDDITTCRLDIPVGEYRYDKHKRTKNFWKVTDGNSLRSFLIQ